MNGKEQAIEQVLEFLKTDEKGLLLTGTNQFEKHYLIMRLLNKYYKNARILFRINALQNITTDSFTPLKRKPKAGEKVRLGNNLYEFDSFNSTGTWYKTGNQFDFAIVYPIDSMCREKDSKPIEDLFIHKHIGKTFLCSWTDRKEYDYTLFSKYYSKHVIYDAEEEDLSYHKRVLENIEGCNR